MTTTYDTWKTTDSTTPGCEAECAHCAQDSDEEGTCEECGGDVCSTCVRDNSCALCSNITCKPRTLPVGSRWADAPVCKRCAADTEIRDAILMRIAHDLESTGQSQAAGWLREFCL